MYNPFRLIVNDREREIRSPAGKVTLDYIRQDLRHTGTKEGCREGECGACTVLLGALSEAGKKVTYRSVNSCLLPVGSLRGKHLVTIEGLNPEKGLNPIQRAFVEQGATQCGFCTPGFIVSLTYFFLESETLSIEEGLEAVSGNICRCTGYLSIKRGIEDLLEKFGERIRNSDDRLSALAEAGIIPSYFIGIPERLLAAGGVPTEEQLVSSPTGIPVAGGTDLYVQRPKTLREGELLFLLDEGAMGGISFEEGQCRIGAGTTMEELKLSEKLASILPRLGEYLRLIASSQIRQRATVGGNLVNASPIGDLTVLFLALDAEIRLAGPIENRWIGLKDFYLGYKQLDLLEGEILREVRFGIPGDDVSFNFEKVSKRTHLDIASVNSAIRLTTADESGKKRILKASLSAGGVAPIPLFLWETGRFLEGKEITSTLLREASEVVQREISPIGDVRGSEEYKRLLLRQLFFAHFLALFPDEIPEEELL